MSKPPKPTRLSKAEMRVIVAKDALAQLRAEKYVAETGNYLDDRLRSSICEWGDPIDPLWEDRSLVNADVQLQPLLKKDKEACTVCAKGALFLSAVRKFNKATVLDLERTNLEVAEKIFGVRQFDLIEAAFEMWDYTKGTDTVRACPEAEAFGEAYPDDHDRLVAILKNIIKNNGTFKP